MKIKKVCGYDLNGWRDLAARNWIVRPGEGDEFGDIHISDGGVLTSVVRTGDGSFARWVGGATAALAPHGRGGGWGAIGHPDKRVSIRAALDAHSSLDVLASALRGLVQGAETAVLAIDDTPDTTEDQQQLLLDTLAAARVRERLLVWRPVLAALFAIDKAIAEVDQRVGVICQCADGFSTQVLRIRREDGHVSAVLAPERRRAGQFMASKLGYRGLVAVAHETIAATVRVERAPNLDYANAVGQLAMGVEVRPELLRHNNGDWYELQPPTKMAVPKPDLNRSDFAALQDCDVVLFETLTDGSVRAELREAISSLLERSIAELPVHSVAEGARLAAARVTQRDPVYFDFLPQISTIVQSRQGAASFDLIRAGATLPAGKLYRSEKPARFGIQQGQERFSVYLRKEAEANPRKAVVELGFTPEETIPVDLWVEQAPAAGRAKIVMQAPSLSRQFTVEWNNAEEIPKTWESLIQDLEDPLPTLPKRLVLPCGMQAWEDSTVASGLSALLEEASSVDKLNWTVLANKLSQRPYGKYCISSDGELPEEVSSDSAKILDALTEQAAELVLRSAENGTSLDFAALRFLTWQFRRCPDEVARFLVRTMDGNSNLGDLITHVSHRKLQYQGLGRIARTPELESEVLALLLAKPAAEWSWQRESACAAFLLSRSDTAPKFLDRDAIEKLGTVVMEDLRINLGSDYTRFSYAPFLLVGVLRWRLKEPRALVAGFDPLADKLRRSVKSSISDIERKLKKLPRLAAYVRILTDIMSELEGEGTNPDLLLDIYNAS